MFDLEKIDLWDKLHVLVDEGRPRQVVLDIIERHVQETHDIAAHRRLVLLDLRNAGEHVVSTEKLVFLHRLARHRQSLTHSEVDQGELELAIIR